MSLFNVFNVAGSGMTAQAQRLNVVASNLANVDSTTSSDGESYKSKQVIFETTPVAADEISQGVRVTEVVEDTSPMKMVYNPNHPTANEQGYVEMPNVDVVGEMVNMISASRSYQNNVEVMNTSKALLSKTLEIGQ